MSMSTGIREVDGVTIVDLSGRVTLGEASGKLRDTVRGLLDNGATTYTATFTGPGAPALRAGGVEPGGCLRRAGRRVQGYR